MIATLSEVSTLGTAKVTVDIVNKGNFEIRPGYAMKPTGITIHNTGNPGRNANAEMHNRYIHNMANKSPRDTGYASWHFSVDCQRIIQHLPLDESAWHCGDGNGFLSGNRTTIGIEICENPETDTHKAEENAIALAAWLIENLDISEDKVYPHQKWSGKYCPRVILGRDGTFASFYNRIKVKVSTNNDVVTVSNPIVKPIIKPVVKPLTPTKVDTKLDVNRKYTLKGDVGSKVKELQALLVKAGYRLQVDGIFGQGTHNAVLAFQSKHKLAVDGVAGPGTLSKLAAVTKPKPTGIKSVGTVEIANLNSFTYIYEKNSDKSTRLGTAKKGTRYPIAGSVAGWYEIIYKGERAYVKDTYCKRV